MFILRLKATLFMGEKIPVQFLGLPPYNLYFFTIHQTPSSLCISRLLISRICSLCSKHKEEEAEIDLSVTYLLCRCYTQHWSFPSSEMCSNKQKVSASLGTLLRSWACQRYMHTPKMLWHPVQPNVLEMGRCLFKYCRVMHSFQLFGTVVVIFSGSFSYISA